MNTKKQSFKDYIDNLHALLVPTTARERYILDYCKETYDKISNNSENQPSEQYENLEKRVEQIERTIFPYPMQKHKDFNFLKDQQGTPIATTHRLDKFKQRNEALSEIIDKVKDEINSWKNPRLKNDKKEINTVISILNRVIETAECLKIEPTNL